MDSKERAQIESNLNTLKNNAELTRKAFRDIVIESNQVGAK